MEKDRKIGALRWVGVVLGVVGLLILLAVDWRIAIGVFFAMWGDKLSDLS